MIIKGFRIKTTDISDIEMEIKKIKRNMDKNGNKLYQKLLGEQAAFLFDQVALNILPAPDCPFLDWVVNDLNLKIQIESQNQVPSDYNFHCFLYVMNYGEYTYLKVLCENPTLLKSFKGLEEYSLSEEECKDPNNKKTQIWNDLHKMYENEAVLSLNLTPVCTPDKDQIVFPSKSSRCILQARHDLTNHYLKMVSGGEGIPPYLIMPCMDEAMQLLMTEDAKEKMKERQKKLTQILPDSKEIEKLMFCPKTEEESQISHTNDK